MNFLSWEFPVFLRIFADRSCFNFMGVGIVAIIFATEALALEAAFSPALRLEQPKKGSFLVENSWISQKYVLESELNLTASLGSIDLSQTAIWFSKKDADWGLKELFIELRGEWGDWRFGMIPIQQSFEGSVSENTLLFPMTRPRRQRWFVRRDFGIEYSTHFDEFTGRWALHNGESSADRDSQMWFSGLWRYQNSEGSGAQLVAFVGRTGSHETSRTTSGAETLGFQFDPSADMKIRHGAMAFYKKWPRGFLLAEFGRGEFFQKDEKQSFVWGHLDLALPLGTGERIKLDGAKESSSQSLLTIRSPYSFLARYEHTQPDARDSDSVTRSLGLGVVYWPREKMDGSSPAYQDKWTFWVQKNAQKDAQNSDIQDDLLEISYQIFSPSIL